MLTRTSGSNANLEVFSGTKVIAEYQNSYQANAPLWEYIYAGGQLLAVVGSNWTRYLHQDHLSPRVITDETGAPVHQQGHFPFGEMWYSQPGNTTFKFTSYARDDTSGLDYAIFRYHAPCLGRGLWD